jgi:tetratricopeptide (TPR) repeat protein
MAEAAFLKAIDLDPGYVEARRNLARLYYLQGRFDKAAYEYGEVVRLAPGDLDSYVQLALAQAETGDFDAAARTLEMAKGQTQDRRIVRQLNGYIEKIRRAE